MPRQEIELGWMNLLPCTKIESRPFPELPVFKSAEQRLYGYVSFDADNWRDDMIAAIKDCALAAIAAAGGVGAISANPGLAFETFMAAFVPCVGSKVADVTISNVHLDTRSVCMW